MFGHLSGIAILSRVRACVRGREGERERERERAREKERERERERQTERRALNRSGDAGPRGHAQARAEGQCLHLNKTRSLCLFLSYIYIYTN